MSKRTKPDADLAKWCALLAENTAPTDIVPPGWLTSTQLAIQMNKPSPTMKHALKRLVDLGRVEVKNFRIQLKKVVRPVPHYRLR